MRLTTTSNIDEVLSRYDQLEEFIRFIAAARALNRLRDQAETAGLRKVNELYDIGPRTMELYLTTTTARPSDLEASIVTKGKGFPLFALKPRQTKQGVSVSIKGKRVLIRRAFLATMPNGHVGVFARGRYGARFQFGAGTRHRNRPRKQRTELPIAELFSFAPADAMGNPDVIEAMHSRVDSQAPIVLRSELRFALQ